MRIFVALILSVSVLGCGVSNYDLGRDYLDQNHVDAAIAHFEAAIDEGVGLGDVHRDLGRAYYRKGLVIESANHLKSALKANPKDAHAALVRGMALEKSGDHRTAIDAYKKFIRLSRFDEIDRQIAPRLLLMDVLSADGEIGQAIQNEDQIDVAQFSTNSIAVLPFQIIDADRSILTSVIQSLTIRDLQQIDILEVVDRVRTQKAISAIGAEPSNLDDATVQRIGRLLGAKRVISAKLEITSDQVKFTISKTDVHKRETIEVSQQIGDAKSIFDLQKQTIFDILKSLNVAPTNNEKKAFLKTETRQMDALIAFGEGLAKFDHGGYENAIEDFRRAVSIDPDFEMARKKLAESSEIDFAIKTDLDQIEFDFSKLNEKYRRMRNRSDQINHALLREFMPPSAADETIEADADLPKTRVTITIKQ